MSNGVATRRCSLTKLRGYRVEYEVRSTLDEAVGDVIDDQQRLRSLDLC